jgi:hypothetical protein
VVREARNTETKAPTAPVRTRPYECELRRKLRRADPNASAASQAAAPTMDCLPGLATTCRWPGVRLPSRGAPESAAPSGNAAVLAVDQAYERDDDGRDRKYNDCAL